MDNLETIGANHIDLHGGIMVMQQWANLLQLQLDENKSYVWANSAELRAQCSMLGWAMKTHAKDLGAPMTYGAKHSVAEQLDRIKALKPLWILLKRLGAPIWAKQRLLSQALWPRAFYGSAICCMSWEHIKHLRTAAMRALRFGRGGANPGMRLGILCPPLTDPGFYQFWTTISTFQRIIQKQPGVLSLWHSFMRHYTGKASFGPFGKLLEVCAHVGWEIDVPYIQDQDGFRFNLIDTDKKLLERLAIDAWRQSIAQTFARRKDASDLQGIDWRVLHAILDRRPFHHQQSLHVLQDGTFIEKSMHQKYDLSQTGHCALCGEVDSMEHRCRRCPARQALYEEHAEVLNLWDTIPLSFAFKLLPSRNPFEAEYKRAIQATTAQRIGLQRLPPRPHLDLFTDGSCLNPTQPWLAVGAWAVVSATHDCVVSRGVLGGLAQTSDLAELIAVQNAVQYAVLNGGITTLWSDSAYVTTGLHRLLCDPMDPPQDQHAREWKQIQQMLFGHSDHILIQHVSSHRQAGNGTADIDDWTAYWNGRADHEAAIAHGLRNPDVELIRQQMLHHHEHQLRIMDQLTHFHYALAQTSFEKLGGGEDDIEEDYEHGLQPELHRHCIDPVDWQNEIPGQVADDWRCVALVEKFGAPFTQGMCQWLRGMTSQEDVVTFKMSFLEIAAMLCSGEVNIRIPQAHPTQKLHWVDRDWLPASFVYSQTVAAVVKLVLNFFAALNRFFDLDLPFVDRLDLTTLGVMTPQRGIKLLVGCDTVNKIGLQLTRFTKRRLVRTACDLARPLK